MKTLTRQQAAAKKKVRDASRKLRGAMLSWGWIRPGGRKDALRP